MVRRICQLMLIDLLLSAACKPASLSGTSPVSPLTSPLTISSHATVMPTPISIGAVVYVVQPGDTLLSLALQSHVPVEQIYYLNGLTPDAILHIGQQLIISDPNRIYIPPPTVTPLPTPEPTSLPTIVPPIRLAAADHLPQISRDLLFINNGRLTLWNHATGQFEVLVGPETSSTSSSIQPVALMTGPGSPIGSVTQFSAATDGRKIALSRVVAFNSYEIAFLDLNTGQLKSVYQGSSQGSDLLGMSISPDGQWIAYIAMDVSSSQDPRKLTGLAAPARYPSSGGTRSGTVYAVRTDGFGQRLVAGVCGETVTQDYSWGCAGLLWSPDSRSIAWSDGRGIWLVQLGQPAKQLITNSLAMPNSQGQGVYIARAFSPSGRYILMTVGYYEGSSTVVLNLETGLILGMPNSFEYSSPGPKVSWISNDRLFVLRAGYGVSSVHPSAEIWHADNAITTTLVLDRSALIEVNFDNILVAPAQLEDGQLAFAVLNTSNNNYADRGLYVAGENDLISHKVNGLPPVNAIEAGGGSPLFIETDIFWSPDGTGALTHDWLSKQYLYVPADGSELYDMSPIIGDSIYGACCFVWIK